MDVISIPNIVCDVITTSLPKGISKGALVIETLKALVIPLADHVNTILNSCNGLLCLAPVQLFGVPVVVVCNPITGEFINLPKSCNTVEKIHGSLSYIVYGLGWESKE
ncbi:hypothetical protein TorRG33x02_165570 [Trema orientale]|uniref:Uncharacterized protein n=1 Tax=Trema orientale TaxID=63057 RepID=A0A2P5EQ82_TREOI|nr:hypothetical protein TorRG33x02_165570 [Trema orientale]